MRRKILMGILAIALPIGTVAAVQTTASAKTGPPDGAVHCTAAGTVVFQAPGLYQERHDKRHAQDLGHDGEPRPSVGAAVPRPCR